MGRINYKEENKVKNKRFSDRLTLLQIIFLTALLIFIFYLFCVQVLDVRHFRVKAKNQRKASAFVMRGDIYDRNGIKLATDKIYMDVYAHPREYDSTPEELAKKLSPILKITN